MLVKSWIYFSERIISTQQRRKRASLFFFTITLTNDSASTSCSILILTDKFVLLCTAHGSISRDLNYTRFSPLFLLALNSVQEPTRKTMAQKPLDAGTHIFKKPADRSLSRNFDAVVPEVQVFRDLVEAERRIDATFGRKHLDLQDSVTRALKKKEKLRVFVSNSVSDQPWQNVSRMDAGNSFDFGDMGSQGSWTLRIEGRLLNDEPADAPNRPMFSTFFTSIAVVFDGDDGTDSAEWHDNPANRGQSVFDVLDVRRKGDRPIRAKILLHLKESPGKHELSPQLQQVLAIQQETRPGAIMALWQYIRAHKLQDFEEKRLIRCDTALKRLFGVDQFHFPQILQLIEPHILQPVPVVIDYTIQVDRENNVGENVYDIEIQTDDPFQLEINNLLKTWNEDQAVLQSLDEQILNTIQDMNDGLIKHKFFSAMSTQPSETSKQWLDSQVADLRTIMSDRGFNEEELRQSSFYSDAVLKQSVHLFLNPNRR